MIGLTAKVSHWKPRLHIWREQICLVHVPETLNKPMAGKAWRKTVVLED